MSTPTDDQVARLPRWARTYIELLEARTARSETTVLIKAGVVQGFVMTRAEVRSFEAVEASSVERDLAQLQGEKP